MLTENDKLVYDAVVEGYAQDGLVVGTCSELLPNEHRRPLTPAEVRTVSRTRRIRLANETERLEFDYELPPDMAWLIVGTSERRTVDVPAVVFKDLVNRNREKASLQSYVPRDLSVVRTPDGGPETVLSFSLPGYSRFSTRALVSVFCTNVKSPHCPTTGDFNYLEKQNGKWRVVARRFMWIC